MVRLDSDVFDWVSGAASSGAQPLQPDQWFDPGFDPYAPTPWMDTPQPSDQSNFDPWTSADPYNTYGDIAATQDPTQYDTFTPPTEDYTGVADQFPQKPQTMGDLIYAPDGNGGGVWLDPNGRIFDQTTGKFFPTSDTEGAKNIYNMYASVRDAYNTDNTQVAGSKFDRLGFTGGAEAPSVPDVYNYYQQNYQGDMNKQVVDAYRQLLDSPGPSNYNGTWWDWMNSPYNGPYQTPKTVNGGGLGRDALPAIQEALNNQSNVNYRNFYNETGYGYRQKETTDPYTGHISNQVMNQGDIVSGNALIRDVAGGFGKNWDPSKLPFGLSYLTDLASPVGVIGIAGGSEIPIIGSALGGNVLKRIAGEAAINALGAQGAKYGGEAVGQFTDNPLAIAAGTVGGALLGGAGAVGGLKAAERIPGLLNAADNALFEQVPMEERTWQQMFPSGRLGAVDPATGMPLPTQRIMGAADVPELRQVFEVGSDGIPTGRVITVDSAGSVVDNAVVDAAASDVRNAAKTAPRIAPGEKTFEIVEFGQDGVPTGRLLTLDETGTQIGVRPASETAKPVVSAADNALANAATPSGTTVENAVANAATPRAGAVADAATPPAGTVADAAGGAVPPAGAATAAAAAATPPLKPGQVSKIILKEIGKGAANAATGAVIGGAVGGSITGWDDKNAIIKGAEIGAGAGLAKWAVTSPAGYAISRYAKAQSAKEVAAFYGAAGIPKPPTALEKLVTLIKTAKPEQKVSAEELSKANRVKAAKLRKFNQNAQGAELAKGAKVLGGEMPKRKFTITGEPITAEEEATLYDYIKSHFRMQTPQGPNDFTIFNTSQALEKVLNGIVPTRGDLKLLEEVFGPELSKAVLDKRHLMAKVGENLMDIALIPRSLMATMDLTGLFNQGALVLTHPVVFAKAAPKMLAAALSPEYAQLSKDRILRDPLYNVLTKKMGVEFTGLTHSGGWQDNEELFASKLFGKIPGMAGSDRAYTTVLNEFRYNLAKNWYKSMAASGKGIPEAELKNMGKWVNAMTGRGTIPEKFQGLFNETNWLFFAPRFAISRYQVPYEFVMSLNPLSANRSLAYRKQVATDLTAFVSAGVGIALAGQAAGWWDVELDPRSSDWMKLKIGPTRIDYWGGEQQAMRLIAQMVTGQTKATSSGEISDASRAKILGKWFRQKLAPTPAGVYDVYKGETVIGDSIDLKKTSLLDQAFQRTMPLYIQDLTEAWKVGGEKSTLLTSVGGLGIRAQTYLTTRDMQDIVAKEKFGKLYEDLPVGDRRVINQDKRVTDITEKFKEEVAYDPKQFFQRKDEVYAGLEKGLRAQIDAGMTGESLKDAISQFKKERFLASETLLGSTDLQQVLSTDERKKVEQDILAKQYWDATLPFDLRTGKYDYKARDAERAQVLATAKEKGIDVNYIIGTGTNTFRGDRFTDPVVREAVLRYETVDRQLTESGYWQIRDDAWAKTQYWFPQTAGFQTYYDYKDAVVQAWTADYISRGYTSYDAQVKALKAFDKTPEATYQTAYVKDDNMQWLLNNVELAYTALIYGYITLSELNKDELAIISWYERNYAVNRNN